MGLPERLIELNPRLHPDRLPELEAEKQQLLNELRELVDAAGDELSERQRRGERSVQG